MATQPKWYTKDDETSWSKVKEAFRRDWQQTKHDFGSNDPDLNQQAGDTISQAAGSKPVPPPNVKTPHTPNTNVVDEYRDDDEPAYRYGYAAYRQYGDRLTADQAEETLRKEWGDEADFEQKRQAIAHGWSYGQICSKNCNK